MARLADRLNEDALRVVESEQKGRNLLELAFGWLLARPVVASVIAGAMTLEQVHRNVGATSWRLTGDELAELEAILPALPADR